LAIKQKGVTCELDAGPKRDQDPSGSEVTFSLGPIGINRFH
jgi:hypothetical protein